MSHHYETLNISKNADRDEIRKAYKSKAGKLHPDREGGDSEEFKKVNHAYSVLFDPERKSLYDLTGSDEKPKDLMTEASKNLGNIFLKIVSEERKGDIVEIVTYEISNSIKQAKQNRDKVNEIVDKFNLLIDRVTSKSENNVYQNMINGQLQGFNLQINGFDEFIKIGDLMLLLLEDYNDTRPDVQQPQNTSTTYTTARFI